MPTLLARYTGSAAALGAEDDDGARRTGPVPAGMRAVRAAPCAAQAGWTYRNRLSGMHGDDDPTGYMVVDAGRRRSFFAPADLVGRSCQICAL